MFSKYASCPMVEALEIKPKPCPPQEFSPIAQMIVDGAPVSRIIGRINATPIKVLKQAFQSRNMPAQEYEASTTLIRFVRAYSACNHAGRLDLYQIEEAIKKKGVEEDFLIMRVGVKEDHEWDYCLSYPADLLNSSRYHVRMYLEKLDRSKKPIREAEAAQIESSLRKMINDIPQNEINKRVSFQDDLTLLHIAAAFGNLIAVKLLMKLGADLRVMASDRLFMTPLQYALAYDVSDDHSHVNAVVIHLIKHGGEIHTRTNCLGGGETICGVYFGANETLLDICAKRNNQAMVAYLLQNGMGPFEYHLRATWDFVEQVCLKHDIDISWKACALL